LRRRPRPKLGCGATERRRRRSFVQMTMDNLYTQLNDPEISTSLPLVTSGHYKTLLF
jgi:hypothetical protein